MYYDKVTRILHWGFALLIPLQLLSEELMKRPKPGRIRDDMQVFFFEMHEWIGMIALVLVLSRLVWGLMSSESSWMRLYPYFSATGRKLLAHEIKHEVPSWFKGKLPNPSRERCMASAVHGLGLLLVLLMGITGALMLYGMEDSGKMLGTIHDAKELHELLGTLLWIYIIAHLAMTSLHMLLGHTMLKRIFCIKDSKANED
jgi:cytochrome b561